jgi:hypothetical protein
VSSPLMTKTCEQCGGSWSTRSRRARTCSPHCRAVLRESEHPSPGASPREYPDDLVRLVLELYASGATIREVDAVIGAGYKAQRIIERFVPERRPAVPRDQTGERNAAWKGDRAGYAAMHLRVQVVRGKPSWCAGCGADDPDVRYEWANLSGRYEDVDDYVRLCILCHRALDALRRKILGRRTSPPRGGGVHV